MSAAKEYHRLRRNISGLTDGQASLGEVDWDSGRLDRFKVTISPSSGPYKGGNFVFSVRLQEDYPTHIPPVVYCETKVKHPNIYYEYDPNDENGDEEFSDEMYECLGFDDDEYDPGDKENDSNICLNLFDFDVWNPSFGLESVVLGLLFLMHNPNFDSPLNRECEYLDEDCREEYIESYMRELLAKQTDESDKENTESKEAEIDATIIGTEASVPQNIQCAETEKQADDVDKNEKRPLSTSDVDDDTIPKHDIAILVESVENSECNNNDSGEDHNDIDENVLIKYRSSVQDHQRDIAGAVETSNKSFIAEQKINDELKDRVIKEMDQVSNEANKAEIALTQMIDIGTEGAENSENKSYNFDEPSNDTECTENISTRLMAFDGGFVLIGGIGVDSQKVNSECVEPVNVEQGGNEPVNIEQMSAEQENIEHVNNEHVDVVQENNEPLNIAIVDIEQADTEQLFNDHVDDEVEEAHVRVEEVAIDQAIDGSVNNELGKVEPVKVEPLIVESVIVDFDSVKPMSVEPANVEQQ